MWNQYIVVLHLCHYYLLKSISTPQQPHLNEGYIVLPWPFRHLHRKYHCGDLAYVQKIYIIEYISQVL